MATIRKDYLSRGSHKWLLHQETVYSKYGNVKTGNSWHYCSVCGINANLNGSHANYTCAQVINF